MLHELEPGFRIPTEEKCKEMIRKSYNWTKENLKELLKSDAESINFTTDLWTSRRNDELLPNPHTSENIKNCINNILEEWNLKEKCFAATTDNGANVKKAISLMNKVEYIGCAAHTLHLSVTKDLEPIKQFIKRDVRTRWNSSYLAWSKLLELKVAITWLTNTLHLAYTKDDRDDGDYLKLIALTEPEWTLLQDLVNLLKPFLDATELLSGSKYTTLSFVYLTIYYLMNKFAPTNGESDDDLFDLIYGPLQSENPHPDLANETEHEGGEANRDTDTINDEENETDSEDELLRNSVIEPRLTRMPLRGARGRGRGKRQGRGQGRGRGRIGVNNERSERRLRNLYAYEQTINESEDLGPTNNRQSTTAALSSNSIITALFDGDDDDNCVDDINEVDAYLSLQVSKQKCDPLNWWKDNSKRFPLLSRIARKYLSIPATSVPSERLFSDAALFSIFPPVE
ncbi:unnamed protein product [Rhizophagus irregularis]|nr:unnamed protein product [Rhizophagus irregularis]